MNPNWHDFLKTQGARFHDSAPEVLDFGQAAEELRAARSGTVIAPLVHLGSIACSGEDAQSFLHNQLTSDIKHLKDDRAGHAAWCTAKGRMLASFVVWRRDGGYRLALAAELVESIVKRLKMYVMRSKVDLADLSETQILLGIAGPEAARQLTESGLAAPGEPLACKETGGVQVIRVDGERFLLSAPAADAGKLWQSLTARARPVGTPAWRLLDIDAALPLVTGATREEFVPQMADFEKIGGVSFHKGCYPGQEIVARTQYLGKVKRHLFRVRCAEPLNAGDELHSPENPDQSVGKIVSAAPAPEGGHVALAVIQSNFADTAHVGSACGPRIEATPVNPCA